MMLDTTLRSRFVMAGRILTHYVEAGENGPAVVLCHGGGAGSSGEAGFGRVMAALAERFQVYAPDSVGGYGLTDPYFRANEGIQSRTDHLGAFVDALCLDEVCLAGNSQGAWVVAKYALEHPDRVKKLFLIASSTISGAMGLKVPVSDGMRVLRAYDGSREAMRRLLEAIVLDKSQITDELIDLRHTAANRPGAPEARKVFEEGQRRLTQDPNMRLKFDMSYALPRLQLPAMFVWGECDNFAPPELGHELQPLLPHIPFHYIPNAGHQAQNDQPEVVGRMMIDFFGS